MIQLDKDKYFELFETDYDQAGRYICRNVKGSLFRYRSFDENGYNLDALKNKKLYLSSPEKLNDPWECIAFCEKIEYYDELNNPNISIEEKEKILIERVGDGYKFISEEYKSSILNKIKENTNEIEQLILRYREELYNQMKKNNKEFRIACFSEKNDNILMWSHYADAHSGFCIEYDISDLRKFNYLYGFLAPVKYLKRPNEVNYIKIDDKWAELRLKYNYCKCDYWMYEQEWRIVLMEQDCINNCIDIIPPKHIYLGIKTTMENEEKIMKIAKEQNFGVSRMKMKYDKYELYD